MYGQQRHLVRKESAVKAGYALDSKATGFGLISLSYHACAVHSDPVTDHLYLVLDANAEPVEALLPIASTEVAGNGKTIYQFDGDEASAMRYLWRGPLKETPHPLRLAIAQVRAGDYANLAFRLYKDGTLIYTKLISSIKEFVLPVLDDADTYEVEIVGTSRTRSVQAAEDVNELT